jgi:hypothetical protein
MTTHQLVIHAASGIPGPIEGASCTCGQSLDMLLPRHPHDLDAQKAFGLHLMAVAEGAEA